MHFSQKFITLLILAIVLAGCAPLPAEETPTATLEPGPTATPTFSGPPPTPLPKRQTYLPGELVEYTAQSGDTLPALAKRFNTSVAEIREANPVIPPDATTMPPGFPMLIPIYYRSFWGTPYQIVPDSLFVNGPAAADFDVAEFAGQYRGWINTYVEYAVGENRTGPSV